MGRSGEERGLREERDGESSSSSSDDSTSSSDDTKGSEEASSSSSEEQRDTSAIDEEVDKPTSRRSGRTDYPDSDTEDDASSSSTDRSSSDSSGSSSSSDSDTEEEALPIADRIRRQELNGVDLKASRQRKIRALEVVHERLSKAKSKKRSKHAPTEASSLRRDFFRRKPSLEESGTGLHLARREKSRDPRLSSLHGRLNVEHFERNYQFLSEIREKEIKQLRQRIAAHTTGGKKGQHMRRRIGRSPTTLDEDRASLKKFLQEKADFERNQIDRASKRAVKAKLHEDVAQGKHGAYYLKRKDRKRLELEAKYEEIRKRGGDQAVNKAVAKRRKKNRSRGLGLLGEKPGG